MGAARFIRIHNQSGSSVKDELARRISLTGPTNLVRTLHIATPADPDDVVDVMLAHDRGKRLIRIEMIGAAPMDKSLAACARYAAACPDLACVGCQNGPMGGDVVAAGRRLGDAVRALCGHAPRGMSLDLSHNDLSDRAILVPLLDAMRGERIAILRLVECALDDSHIPTLVDFLVASPRLESVEFQNKWSHESVHKLLAALEGNTILRSVMIGPSDEDFPSFVHLRCIWNWEKALTSRNEELALRVNRTAAAAIGTLRILLGAKSASSTAAQANSTPSRQSLRSAPPDAGVICNDCSDGCPKGCTHGPSANGLRRSKRRLNPTRGGAAPCRTRDNVLPTDIFRGSHFARLPSELRLKIAQHCTGDPNALTTAQWSRLVKYAADRRTLKRTRMPRNSGELRYRSGDERSQIARWLRARGCYEWEGPPPPLELDVKEGEEEEEDGGEEENEGEENEGEENEGEENEREENEGEEESEGEEEDDVSEEDDEE